MTAIRVLLAGESWVSSTTHVKGFDFFSSTAYDTGLRYLQNALTGAGMTFTHLPNHLADREFPNTPEALAQYDVIILSDIGANTLLLHPDTWFRGQRTPNRLHLLRDWVAQGGGLAMAGGYYSFAGIYGAAKYYRTPIEVVLPVSIYPFDDRLEAPQGVKAVLTTGDHPILDGLPQTLPDLLGFNEVTLKPEARLLATVDDHPLLAVRQFERGRALAWTSDIGPHWCPESFAASESYRRLWVQAVEWLASRR